MCYSAQASFTAFFISLLFIVLLWNRNANYDRWNALFILSFAMIQVWEGLIWTFGFENEYITKIVLPLILITLYTQPFTQTYMAYRYTKSHVLYIMSVLYLMILLFTISRAFTEKTTVCKGPNGHLVWNFTHETFTGVFYLIGMFLGLIYGFPMTLPLFLYGIFTFLYSMKYWNTGEFSSYWCFIAVGYSILAYMV